MVKKTKGKHRLDKFYHLAKEQGYRSRAAFKLIQLNRKYDFLSGARTLVDLCAAPGGWCQVAVKNMPVGSLILGVDLAPIKPIRGVKTFVGDITTQKCRQQIRKESQGQLIDVVLHDGAPNVGGAWSSEAYSQSWLVLEALKLATDVLAPRGVFVTKVFRSKDYSALLYALKQLFTKVEATKPAASRNASAEIFVVCQGYKAPSKIDPRLLDPKHLFNDVTEAPKNAGPDALLKQKIKQRRFREGYEDGAITSRKVLSGAAFIQGDAPVEMLGQYTAIDLGMGLQKMKDSDGEEEDSSSDEERDPTKATAAYVQNHPATTSEIRILCDDLQVLGRNEFKQLLRWRLTLKKDLQKAAKAKAKAAAEKADGDEEAEEASPTDKAASLEEKLLDEMTQVKDRMDRRHKREKKRKKELKNKARVRAAQLAQAEGIGEDDQTEGLFSLSTLKTKKGKGVDGMVDADAPTDSEVTSSSDDDGRGRDGEESDDDSDEERRKYDAAMDEYLEESYKSWKIRQRMKNSGGGVVKKKRRRLGMDGELDEEENEEQQSGSESEEEEANDNDDDVYSASEESESDEEGGGLVVKLDARKGGRAATADAVANQWFSQDLFEDENLDAYDESEEHSDEEEEDMNGNNAMASSEDEDTVPTRKQANGFTANGIHTSDVNGPKNGGFEVVPISDSDNDSDDSVAAEYEALSDDAKAEVRALAKKFLRRKTKEDIMEAAYNRYAFHDEGLPRWFMEDERKYMAPAPHITAEEYKAAKEELRAIDARPIKKVAEAKARKRKRLGMRLAKAKSKAEAIANQEDVPMKAKMREIEKLYASARSGGGGKKKKTSRNDQYKKKGPALDKRLRADKRGMDAAKRRAKKRGKGGRR